jgi:hypothetical protein
LNFAHFKEISMRDAEKLGLIVVVTTYRKTKGGKRDGRNNFSGKVGKIFRDNNGQRGEELFCAKEPNFKELSRTLHGEGKIPSYIAINSRGETHI